MLPLFIVVLNGIMLTVVMLNVVKLIYISIALLRAAICDTVTLVTPTHKCDITYGHCHALINFP